MICGPSEYLPDAGMPGLEPGRCDADRGRVAAWLAGPGPVTGRFVNLLMLLGLSLATLA